MLLALTLLTGSASAECAWVLWFTSGHLSHPITSPTDGFTDREQCILEAAKRTAGQIKDYKAKFPDDVADVTCLPDTVDPRGPKGK